MNENEMLDALSSAVDRAGGVRAFARAAGLSPSYVSRVLRAEKLVSDTMLAAAGLQRVVTYKRVRVAK